MQRRYLTATLFLILLSFVVRAQRPPLDRCVRDSLFLVMPHENPVHTAKIYLEISDQIRNALPQKAFSYIVSAFKIAVCEKNDTLKALSRMKMGSYYNERRNFLESQKQFLSALRTYQMLNDTLGQIDALSSIGILNRELRNFKLATEYLQRGVGLAAKSNQKARQGLLLGHVALTYQAMSELDSAEYFFNKALEVSRRAGDRQNELTLLDNIACIYMDRNQEKEALAMFGNVLKETDSSFLMLRGILYTRIGHINYKNKDYRTALKYDLMALHVRHLDRSPVAVNSSLINVAGDYLKLGNLDSGTIYMDSGMIMAVRYDRKTYVENGYRHLYNYYLEQGMYKIALDYWVRYRTIKDELDREKERNYIAILETNQHLQQVEQSRRENATQHDIQALNLKQQGYQTAILKILTTMAAFAMLVIVLWFLNIRRLRHRMQEINVHLSEEIRERESAEQQTRERDSQYRFITDNSVDFITHTDHEHRRIYASPASRWIYGYEPGEILSKSPHDLTNPEFHEYTDARLKEMKERRTTQQFVYLARKKDGSSFWVESILNPLFDPASGNFKGMVGVTRDIQERKTKELEIMEGTKQKENLLKEIHHRVKNNFAILVSLINMQMAQTKNEELLQSLTNLQLRIRTMALVHEMLYRSGDFEKISFPGYLRSLASVIAGTYNRRNVELTIDAEEVVMDIEALIPLGLIINELLSNAYKHAFRDGRAGKIHIRYCVDPETGINTLAVKDNGTGLPSGIHPDQFKSMGLQVVQILCTQIEGTLVTVNDPGASFTITFRPSVK